MPTHAAIELAFGLAVMASPLVLGFGNAGAIAAFAAGALLVGLALSAASSGLSVGTHALADWAMAVAMIGLASVLGVVGDVTAFAFLALAGLVELLLHSTTRYSAASA